MKVRKAIIPCAGFGTRFLPITKVVPKEILPIIDTPTLEYIMDEAEQAGIEEIMLIVSKEKLSAIQRLIEGNLDLNKFLLEVKKDKEYKLANKERKMKISFAIQQKKDGNGRAIECAKDFAAGEPIAVLFGDDVMRQTCDRNVTKQLIDAYEKLEKNVVGCQRTDETIARRCGVMKIKDQIDERTFDINGIIEKPKGDLPSDLVSLGRFILHPEIFEVLAKMKPDKVTGEIYLTEALSELAEKGRVVAYDFVGDRYDIGNKLGFILANIDFALLDPLYRDDLIKHIKGLNLNV